MSHPSIQEVYLGKQSVLYIYILIVKLHTFSGSWTHDLSLHPTIMGRESTSRAINYLSSLYINMEYFGFTNRDSREDELERGKIIHIAWRLKINSNPLNNVTINPEYISNTTENPMDKELHWHRYIQSIR